MKNKCKLCAAKKKRKSITVKLDELCDDCLKRVTDNSKSNSFKRSN